MPLSDSFKLKEMVQQLGADPDDYDAAFYEELIRSHCESSGIRLGQSQTRPRTRSMKKGRDLRFKLDPHFNKSRIRSSGTA